MQRKFLNDLDHMISLCLMAFCLSNKRVIYITNMDDSYSLFFVAACFTLHEKDETNDGNRGAKDVKGKSVGCNIVLPFEQKFNNYMDRWVEIDYFFVRKVLLSKYSYVFIVMPGGYGTLDEFFESLTLIQTLKIKKFPVVLMGKDYHLDLMKHLDNMEKTNTISTDDKKLFLFTDSIEEAVQHIKINAIQKFNLRTKKVYKPIKLLGEG